MNPAFSVILFTTLSGAGYGLLLWWTLALYSFGIVDAGHETLAPWMVAFALGLVLVSIGLSSSVFHLGKPLRAWRAFSQWRTSWLSREGVASIIVYAAAGVFLLSVYFEWMLLLDVSAVMIAIASIGTVYCTAMIYASLRPVPAWRHPLVIPGYFAFALLTGGLVCLGIYALVGDGTTLSVASIATMVLIAAATAVIKLIYWRAIDQIKLPSRESATALDNIGTVTTFERPHTEANYLTNEMGFVLARKHARKLRVVALLLFAGIPLFALLIAATLPATAGFALWIAALAALAGAFVERWLFFAEAKHMVMLYY